MYINFLKTVFGVCVLFFSIQLINGCRDSYEQPVVQTKICGQVVEDGNTSRVIAGANVEIIENNTSLVTLHTDDNGSFCFASSLVSEANFYVKVMKNDYATAFVEVNNTAAPTQLDDILLTKLSDPVIVTSAGGTINLENNVSVHFPAGTVDEDISVQATPTKILQAVSTENFLLYSIDLRAKKRSTGEEVHNFSNPIELSMPIPAPNINIEEYFKIYYFDENQNKLVLANFEKKIENGYVKIKITHFSSMFVYLPGFYYEIQWTDSTWTDVTTEYILKDYQALYCGSGSGTYTDIYFWNINVGEPDNYSLLVLGAIAARIELSEPVVPYPMSISWNAPDCTSVYFDQVKVQQIRNFKFRFCNVFTTCESWVNSVATRTIQKFENLRYKSCVECCNGKCEEDISSCPNECNAPNSCKTKECPDGSKVCPDAECPTD